MNNHILTAQGSPQLTRPGSTTHSQLRRADYLAAHLRLPLREAVEIANAAGALAVTLNGASCSIPPLSDLTSPGTVQPAPVVTPAKEIK